MLDYFSLVIDIIKLKGIYQLYTKRIRIRAGEQKQYDIYNNGNAWRLDRVKFAIK